MKIKITMNNHNEDNNFVNSILSTIIAMIGKPTHNIYTK